MRAAATTLFMLIGLVSVTLGAQGRGGRDRDRERGVPPGHMPPAGECRVWYDGLPPGQQPSSTNCREAERLAARDSRARVIYGERANGRVGRRDDRHDDWDDDDREDRDDRRAIPRRGESRNPDADIRYPDRDRGDRVTGRVPFNNGYDDGLDAGREDARRNRSYDPERNSHYRAASRGYDPRYGSRDEYRDQYRDGFRSGYEDGYRDNETRRRGGFRFPWPF